MRRPLPTMSLELLDPFLLIDEMGPVDYAPGAALGAPDHPHRGFETVTYVLEGEGQHEDSAGHRGVIGAGDVQWMTAGSGVVHAEMPSVNLRRDGGRMHGFQIWVNLPAHLKMTPPRYQELKKADIPRASTEDGLAEVTVIAGSALGVTAAIDTHTPITYLDITVAIGGAVELPLPAVQNGALYVFSGELLVGKDEHIIKEGQLAVLGPGDRVAVRNSNSHSQGARALLLGGKPLNEPVARYGPFVMNTPAELRQAFDDYQAGKMGKIRRA